MPYKSDTNIEDIKPKNMCDDVNILSPVIYIYIILNLGHKVYNWAKHEDLMLIHISRVCKTIHIEIIFFTYAALPVTIIDAALRIKGYKLI